MLVVCQPGTHVTTRKLPTETKPAALTAKIVFFSIGRFIFPVLQLSGCARNTAVQRFVSVLYMLGCDVQRLLAKRMITERVTQDIM